MKWNTEKKRIIKQEATGMRTLFTNTLITWYFSLCIAVFTVYMQLIFIIIIYLLLHLHLYVFFLYIFFFGFLIIILPQRKMGNTSQGGREGRGWVSSLLFFQTNNFFFFYNLDFLIPLYQPQKKIQKYQLSHSEKSLNAFIQEFFFSVQKHRITQK